MSAPAPGMPVRLVQGAYRVLLLAYPRAFRRRAGRDMAEVFVDLCTDARQRGGLPGIARFVLRTFVDVARNGAAERIAARRRRSNRPLDNAGLAAPRPGTGDHLVNSVIRDVRFALRTLIKQPSFSLTVVVVLGLGIAGTTAIFGIFNGLFLRPLPFEEPGRLVNIDETAPRWNLDFVSVNYADFVDWSRDNETFEAMAVLDDESANLSLDGEATRVETALASHGLFDVLRIEPVIGRRFTEEEDKPGAAGVALLGNALWRERFGGDPGVVGRTLRLDSEPYTVIGVLPPEASFVPGDVWVPLRTDVTENQGSWWLYGIGRLRRGVTPDRAREDLSRIHKAVVDDRPVNAATSPVVLPILDRILGDYRLGTLALLGGVSVVLIIACANVAGLMLARSTSRSREVGIRVALGAGRGRIVQQMLTESLMLSAGGTLLGVGLGYLAGKAALAAAPESFPRWIRFDLDVRVLGFAVAVTVGAALLFGLAPALKTARTDPQRTLQGSGRATGGRSGRRGLDALVVGEVALALVLLIGAGLSMVAFQHLRDVDPGFRPVNVLRYRIALPDATYGEDSQKLAFFRSHLDAVRALPGVLGVGATTAEPLGGHSGNFFEAEGAEPRGEDEPNPVTLMRRVTPGYFDAIGINLLAGRAMIDADGNPDSPLVVIVNQTFARHHWGDQDPIGKRIRFQGGADEDWMTVIGLTQNVRHYGLDQEMIPGVYLPYDISPRSALTIVARTAGDPLGIGDQVRTLVRDADAELPVFGVATMEQRLRDSLWAKRAASWAFAVFAGIALALAVSGIYGVVSYAVSRRTHEIGIRMALGARRAQVLGQVVRHGVTLVGLGVGLGLGCALLLAWGISGLLFGFGVSTTDPAVYAGVTLLLAAVALLANLVPARRAAAVDPVDALREE